MKINKKSLFEYFEDKKTKSKFIYEIDTKKKKNFYNIVKTVYELKTNYNFKKKRVICILPNCISYIEFFFAITSSGGVFVPLPYFTEKNELKKILKFIKPNMIVSDGNKDLSFFKKKIINVNKISNKKVYKNKLSNNELKDLACIYYSSGTTGNPKGIMYSHENMIALIESINKDFKFGPKDRHLTFLPFGHTASINYNILPSLMTGSELFISKGFDKIGVNFFNILQEYKITYTQIVPSVLFILNKMNINIGKKKFNNLKFIGCGSSFLPLSKQIEFIQKYKIKVANLYGLSETGPTHIDDPRKKNWRPGTIGKPLSVCKFKLDKKNNILIKGKNVFIGYYKNKKLFEKSFVNKKWFITGDIGKKEKGKIFFLDRSKDLIIKNGINIVPGEIEEAIYKSKKILECCVVGIDDEIQGEEIAVAIKPNNSNLSFNLLVDFIKKQCKQSLSNYKVPKHFYLLDNFPKTASGKIKRRLIRKRLNLVYNK
tara:strand:+ start:93 stop:1550 length:1458 start_codon:yes stop_codon:yes gene_type:complete